tara:strand:- start:362 stop:595 length:234 start_codon:yes stop_codon:yes gene_type:complete
MRLNLGKATRPISKPKAALVHHFTHTGEKRAERHARKGRAHSDPLDPSPSLSQPQPIEQDQLATRMSITTLTGFVTL